MKNGKKDYKWKIDFIKNYWNMLLLKQPLKIFIFIWIKEYGFINLDFLGNLGHSIVNRSEDRIYIEKGNKTKLIDVNYFTFEPHISVLNSKYGYKKENIYRKNLKNRIECDKIN